jgi:homoserine kinase
VTPVAVPQVRIIVPASTANLGSGFDTLGMALARYDVVDVRIVESGLRVWITGENADSVPTDERHLVVRALRAAARHIGLQLNGVEMRCHNSIPHSRGLGSSAAAVVAGIAVGYGLAGREVDQDALDLAADFEGHADNAAASLYGGLVLAWQDGGQFQALRLTPHEGLRPVVLIPEQASSTEATRGLLPATVPHADAAFAAARTALAVQALTDRTDLLLPATDDRLHQNYRESAWPPTMRLVRELRSSGVAAAVSGAGPTVIALTLDGALPDGIDRTGFEVCELPIDRTGVRIEPISEWGSEPLAAALPSV